MSIPLAYSHTWEFASWVSLFWASMVKAFLETDKLAFIHRIESEKIFVCHYTIDRRFCLLS